MESSAPPVSVVSPSAVRSPTPTRRPTRPTPTRPPFFLAGVIEGFYGRPWTRSDRAALVATHLAPAAAATASRARSQSAAQPPPPRWVYVYAPKDDPQHRTRWRETYARTPQHTATPHSTDGPRSSSPPPQQQQQQQPAATLARLAEAAETAAACHAAGVEFVYALAPGLDMSVPFSARDAECVRARVAELVRAAAVRSFALFFDDLPPERAGGGAFSRAELAGAQAALANAAAAAVREELVLADAAAATAAAREGEPPGGPLFLVCPTEYCAALAEPSVARSPYLAALGRALDPATLVFWTGPDIISETIAPLDTSAAAAALRRPPLIWDNIFANDYDVRRVYLGPYVGRPRALAHAVAGVLLNPNCEFHVNFVPLRSFVRWVVAATARDATTAPPPAAEGGGGGGGGDDDDDEGDEGVQEAAREWLPLFESPPPSGGDLALTEADTRLLVDLFWLPHRHGPRGRALLADLRWLLERPARGGPASSPGQPPETPPSAPDPAWAARAAAFRAACADVVRLFDRLTCVANRELLYALYGYVWEIKEECLLMSEYVAAKECGEEDVRVFREYRPGVWRGGLAAECQRLLVQAPDARFRPATAPGAAVFVLRPAVAACDAAASYAVCLQTDRGEDGTPFYRDPRVLGRRYVGPYLALEPDLAFVLEDAHGVCGYVLGALDTRVFERRFDAEWAPHMQARYYPSVPARAAGDGGGGGGDGTRDLDVIAEFHAPHAVVSNELFASFPSHLHIDILPRAQGRGCGPKMIRHLEAVLRERGSRGVHLGVFASNTRARRFYEKMGYRLLWEDANDAILGKRLDGLTAAAEPPGDTRSATRDADAWAWA